MESVEVEESKDKLAQSQNIKELLGTSNTNFMSIPTPKSNVTPRRNTVQVRKNKNISINVEYNKW